MKITDTITRTYTLYDDFFIDIIDDGKDYEAYLGHKTYAAKRYMFGQQKATISQEDFEAKVEANAPEYIRQYKDFIFEEPEKSDKTIHETFDFGLRAMFAIPIDDQTGETKEYWKDDFAQPENRKLHPYYDKPVWQFEEDFGVVASWTYS